mmetsp:Transcript_46563/g.68808  ORF Transcript_46563/g.68808 Transcript_46563/m.68808 type:complete len:356 (+) Transcript_46563:99-1166(+)
MISVLLLCLLSTKLASGLQIGSLLSTCVDACQRGCTEIRNVQTSRGLDNSGALKFELKDSQEPRSALTEADGAAQRAIIGLLRAEWGDELRIIGEEDDDHNISASTFLNDVDFKSLCTDIFDDDIGETEDIDASKVTIFVDPLDGTREFVEGRLANCQVLVGIAIEGESVAGAVGIPFPAGDMSTDSTIVYGLADMGCGVLGAPLTRGPYPLDHNIDGVKYPRPHHATGDSKAEVLIAIKDGVIEKFGGSNVNYGGAGNKILGAALGEVASSLSYKVGGPWDLCAPEAILKAMGGKITDIFGEEIAMYRLDAPARSNERGYLATPPGSGDLFHEAYIAKIGSLPEVQKYRKELEK